MPYLPGKRKGDEIMKTIPSLRGHLYLRSVGILLIVVALVAGIVSCTTPADTYELAMAVNPAGAGTATDETGTSPYTENTVVDIKAVAADCYQFVSWTAPAGTFGNATAAETTFTMPARDVTVTANFELKPADHYKFYTVEWQEGLYVGKEVLLEDQFGTFNATVGDPICFGNPAEKVHGDMVSPIADDNRHFTIYELDYGEEEPMLNSWRVVVNNQFQDDVELTVIGPVALAVPTQKEDHETPGCLSHYLLYDAYGPVVNDEVVLSDQFIEEADAVVYEPYYFANPVQKTIVDNGDVTEIEEQDPHRHLVFYSIESKSIEKRIQIANQFGNQILDLSSPELLAVPSQKISWEQPLDHFKTYWATWAEEPPPTFPAVVKLEDQFITAWLGEPLNATVLEPVLFANPVNKIHGDFWTPVSNWNDHYTFYSLSYKETPPMWEVTFDNQFSVGEPQTLYVSGPDYLAVPTKKGSQDPPMGLDHFLLYKVIEAPPLDVDVFLRDQFIDQVVTVYGATYFANPVVKTYGDITTPINHPDDHLVFYSIDGGEFELLGLPIDNQFGLQFLDVLQEDIELLGVPSQKLAFHIVP